jgi:hypothetical protein
VRPPRLGARRPRLLAAGALTALTCALLLFQPLGSPWWTGGDWDSIYASSGLSLAAGEQSRFYDHPGMPLQEALAATFTVGGWIGGETRRDHADRLVADLDLARPYLRTIGSLVTVASVLLVFLTLAWLTGSALLGFVGGVFFLGAPEVIAWAAVVRPDTLLGALSVAAVGLLVAATRRRSAGLFVGAAFVIGFAISVKMHAVGLLAPFGLAFVLAPPRELPDLRPLWRAHRRAVAIGSAAFVLAAAVLNFGGPAPPLTHARDFVLALLIGGIAAALVWLAVRRTRAAPVVGTALACGVAAVAGLLVPNLLYPAAPPTMVRWLAQTLFGGGPNTGAHPVLAPWDTLSPWTYLMGAALLGVVLALRDRDFAWTLFAVGGVAMGFLAWLRFGHVHYYTPAVALAVPLAVRGLQPLRRWNLLLVAVAFVVAIGPIRDGIDEAQSRGSLAESTEQVNDWVDQRLGNGQVALSQLESSDGRWFSIVHFYAPWAEEPAYRFLPPDQHAAEYVRSHGLDVAYVVTGSDADVDALLESLGLPGRATRIAEAPGFVYRVLG